jgi:hypothetical protein
LLSLGLENKNKKIVKNFVRDSLRKELKKEK